ncbi:Prolyl 4-hydroxylase subunit alpha-1 [Lamellibrachia satsuma]|nr:Prolyl 4-hydroxylase subunit alpha-1 [Lamellibrachia satsuma]
MVCKACSVCGEVFTSIADLEKILYAENDVAIDLKQYIASEEQRLEKLKRIAEDYRHHSSDALEDVDRHLANPVNAFLLVKRFTSDWEEVLDLIRNTTGQGFLAKVEDKTSCFPNSDDLTGAASALLRLQDVYALKTEQIAKGHLRGVKNSPELTAEECFEIGRTAYNDGDHYHAVMWMQHALDVERSQEQSSLDEALLLDYLAYSTYLQGNLKHALNLTNELLVLGSRSIHGAMLIPSLHPIHMRAKNNKKYYEEMIVQEEKKKHESAGGDTGEVETDVIKNKRQLDDYRRSSDFSAYEALCRGEETHVYEHAHKLTCQYRRHHPMFYINPLREEVMYLDPRIVVFHNLITDAEIAKVKELAKPRLNRATVQNPQTGKLETANYRVSKRRQTAWNALVIVGPWLSRSTVFTQKKDELSVGPASVRKYRTSKSAWLKDEEDPLIRSISLKSAALSNLTLNTVEELQVLNYGIGGHYEPHYDFARKTERGTFEEWRGNRVATVIYYMTDIPAGGGTVFTNIGVRLTAEKGACAIWYNLRRNGEGDMKTRHAACPVLVGQKWVCNKWFHERGQEFSRGCSQNPEE